MSDAKLREMRISECERIDLESAFAIVRSMSEGSRIKEIHYENFWSHYAVDLSKSEALQYLCQIAEELWEDSAPHDCVIPYTTEEQRKETQLRVMKNSKRQKLITIVI